MTDQEDDKITGNHSVEGSSFRPFSLSLLCLFAFVYYGIIGFLFLVSLFYSGWLTHTINQYIPENEYTTFQVMMITLAGAALHGTALTGIALMWKLRKKGYFLFGISTLIISSFHLLLSNRSFLSLTVYIGLILLFGLFYRKLG